MNIFELVSKLQQTFAFFIKISKNWNNGKIENCNNGKIFKFLEGLSITIGIF